MGTHSHQQAPLRLSDWSHDDPLGQGSPDGPPLTLGFVPVSFTRKFADILVIDCL